MRVAELGTPPIDIFFVLSGFLITGILLDMRGEPGCFRRFYLRRGLRIFPLYSLFLFVVCVLLPPLYRAGRASATSLDSLTDTVRHWPWFVSYLSNYLFALKKSFMDRTLAVTWLFGVEEQFCLAWALLVAFIPVRRLLWLWGALIPLTIAWRVGLLRGGSGWVPVWVTTPSHLAPIGGSLVAAWLRMPGYRPGAAARLAIGLAGGIGWLSWRFVEAPLPGLKDRWAPGPARREAAPA